MTMTLSAVIQSPLMLKEHKYKMRTFGYIRTIFKVAKNLCAVQSTLLLTAEMLSGKWNPTHPVLSLGLVVGNNQQLSVGIGDNRPETERFECD